MLIAQFGMSGDEDMVIWRELCLTTQDRTSSLMAGLRPRACRIGVST